jgi:hypothetical protein
MKPTTDITLIGICGPAGCGKDTVRDFLEFYHGFKGLAFADPFRNMLHELLTVTGVSYEYIIDRKLKEAEIPGLGVSYRRMAQTLGTEWGRDCLGADFWLNVADRRMADLRGRGCRKLVASDVRFANEAAWVRAQGGVVWLIDRPGVAPVQPHVTEAMAFEPDTVVRNHGSLDELSRAVVEAYAALAEQRAREAASTTTGEAA